MPKLAKFEDWKAPWEVDLKEGDEPTFDFEKGKKYLYNVLSDKEKLQGQIETLTTERDTLKAEKDAKDREGESELQKAQRERDEAIERANKSSETSVETLKLRVALRKGLTEVQAKRLVGSTEEELEADADELLESFGGSGKSGEGEGEEDEPGETPVTRPQRRLSNAGDPDAGAGPKWDVDAAADEYLAGSGF